jgi:signal transduction histidine kinase
MIAGLLICLLAAASAAPLLRAPGAAEPASQKPLVLFGDKDYPPSSFRQGTTISGVDVEIARALSSAMGREVRIELLDWAEAQQRMLRGEGDGLLSMSDVEERRRIFDFTQPIASHDFGFFVRSSGPAIRRVEDADGKRVGVTAGGLPRQFLESRTGSQLVLIDHYEDGFSRLASGDLDAVAADLAVGAFTIEQLGLRGIVQAGQPFARLSGGIAVAKGNQALINQIDGAIATLESDGTLDRIRRRWRPKQMLFLSRERAIWIGTLASSGAFALIAIAVTARRRQTAAMLAARSLEAELRQSQRLETIGSLTGAVAHDFNNALHVVEGCAELAIQQLEPTSPVRPDIDEIRRVAKTARALTRQLLMFTRGEGDGPRPLDINCVVSGLDRMLGRLMGYGTRLEMSLDAHAGYVMADEVQIEQVIMNLAVNARDAMPDGGSLTIRTAVETVDSTFARRHLLRFSGEFVTLSVIDTGTGMSDDVRARIFEPLFTTKERSRGAGLGLATVHRIVREAGGCVTVASKPGRGTTFIVYLPRIAPSI